MRSPTAALVWEIWRRNHRLVAYVFLCLASSALINGAIIDRLPASARKAEPFASLFGILMVSSFLFLMGVFNYTEFNPTKEWNGFPYRLFTLPVRTWKLVAVPMILGLASVELLYLGWIKLVWTHTQIAMPVWFAVVLGAYTVFYQATLWSLAGFRILRLIVLTTGGVSSVGVACLPVFANVYASPWISQKRLTAILVALSFAAWAIAWAAVARQRFGGGRRQNGLKVFAERVIDLMPRCTAEFGSAAAAQFWYQWRRGGWLLPACVAFALVVIFAPVSWMFRADPQFTVLTLIKVLAMPLVIGFAIGKGFIKPEIWSTKLSLPPFLAVKPLSAGDFVVTKMRVAAVSVAIAWIMVVAFIALWLPLWADNTRLQQSLTLFPIFYPRSWQIITILSLAGLVVLTWRFMVSGLWLGLLGRRGFYVGSICFQIGAPCLALLACGIWSESIDVLFRDHPDRVKTIGLLVIGWGLALAVILKVWLAVFSWKTISRRRTWRYMLTWSMATLGFVTLAAFSRPVIDPYRLGHLFLLGAFLAFPFARIGIAPLSFERNRHL